MIERVRRRSGMLLCAGAAVVAGLGLWALWFEPARLIVREQHVTTTWQGGPPLRIAILTDLHVGSPFNGLDKLRTVVARTNDARPDLICILGDLVIQGVAGGRFVSPEAIAQELRGLRARDGVVAVLGNHDDWLDGARVRSALVNNGVSVVEETAVAMKTARGTYWVAGVSDLWTGTHDVAKALRGVPDSGGPILLLTHNPDVFPDVPARVALTLAGHTHGGQVRFPLLGAPIIPSRFGQRFAAGLVVEDGRHLFVATGVGTSIIPVRFRVPPEISIVIVGESEA